MKKKHLEAEPVVVVVGGGIAGALVAKELQSHAWLVLIDPEETKRTRLINSFQAEKSTSGRLHHFRLSAHTMRKKRMASWSELPRDILELITRLLPLGDTHRFSAVCQSWCSLAKEKRHLPVPQLPWLVLANEETSGKQRFFNMSENKYYQFDIPELCGAYIVGSSFGWLFAVGPKLDAYLVNPFSGAKFTLPSLPSYAKGWEPENLTDLVDERNEYDRPRNNCFETVQHSLVRKAVLSADPSKCTNFRILIMLNGDYRLAFFKFGDTTWFVFDYERGVDDIVYFQGQFYAVILSDILVTVHVGPLPKLSGHKRIGCGGCYWDNIYLVSFGMHLLFVLRRFELADDHRRYTTDFRVFKVDLRVDNTSALKDIDTCEIKDIEGNALFLAKNNSIVVRASDFNGCMTNSLYFSADSYNCFARKKYGYDDMGVYKLEDRTIVPFYPSEIYHPPQSCPIWLVPNPW